MNPGLAYRQRRAADLAAKAIAARRQTGVVTRAWGVITATHSAPTSADAPWPSVTVLVAGTSIPGVRYAKSYTPTIGDTVAVDIVGTDPVVWDTLA